MISLRPGLARLSQWNKGHFNDREYSLRYVEEGRNSFSAYLRPYFPFSQQELSGQVCSSSFSWGAGTCCHHYRNITVSCSTENTCDTAKKGNTQVTSTIHLLGAGKEVEPQSKLTRQCEEILQKIGKFRDIGTGHKAVSR